MPIFTNVQDPDLKAEEGINWIDIDLTQEDDRAWLAKQSGLSGEVVAQLERASTKSFRLLFDQGAVVSFSVKDANVSDHETVLTNVGIFIGPNQFITIRTGALPLFDRIRHEIADSEVRCLKTAKDIFGRLSSGLVDAFEKKIFSLSDEVVGIEEQYFRSGSRFDFDQARSFRVDAIRTRRSLTTMKYVLSLVRSDTDVFSITGNAQAPLSQAIEMIQVHLDSLDDLLARIDILQTQDDSLLSRGISRSSFNLTIVATVFLPLTFVSGLLGMNVGGIPDTHSPWGFWGITGAMLILSGCLWVYLFKRFRIDGL